jgi:hypothetical protein
MADASLTVPFSVSMESIIEFDLIWLCMQFQLVDDNFLACLWWCRRLQQSGFSTFSHGSERLRVQPPLIHLIWASSPCLRCMASTYFSYDEFLMFLARLPTTAQFRAVNIWWPTFERSYGSESPEIYVLEARLWSSSSGMSAGFRSASNEKPTSTWEWV